MSLIAMCFFFFNDTAPTEIYTLSLHDALPISQVRALDPVAEIQQHLGDAAHAAAADADEVDGVDTARSEEHTSELQSQSNLVCRLLLEKKKKTAPTRRAPSHRCCRRQSFARPR